MSSFLGPGRLAALLASVALASAVASPTPGDVTGYHDKASWLAAVGSYSTIAFVGYAEGTHVDVQYASSGARFIDPYNFIDDNEGSYLNDGMGIASFNIIDIAFDRPLNWFATDFPGTLWFELYLDDRLVHASQQFGFTGTGQFGGVVSTEPFNRVVMCDPAPCGPGSPHIDDIFFGPIPCLAEVTLDGVVGVDDLVAVLDGWTCDPPSCGEADVTRDGTVDVDDLVAVILAWGPCPQ